MIGYLSGTLFRIYPDRVLVLTGGVGYEVFLPAYVMEETTHRREGDAVSLFIYHQQSERQPRPVLIGFPKELEKAFFQQFVTVEDIGVNKALKAMTIPPADIAAAIENRDIDVLTDLRGIGKRTAEKIVATLSGKMGMFLSGPPEPAEEVQRPMTFAASTKKPVLDLLVDRLGYRISEARRMIDAALAADPDISTPEALIEAVLRDNRT
jgi:Holliday junction DNA helicase RuvA